MLAFQHLLIFSMMYIVLIKFFKYEVVHSVKWINIVIFSLLLILDLLRQQIFGYQTVHPLDPIIGSIALTFVCLYLINGLKNFRKYICVVIAFFVCLYINNISTRFIFTIFNWNILKMENYSIYNTISVISGLLLLLLIYKITKSLKLEFNIFHLKLNDIGIVLIFMFLYAFYISSMHTVSVNYDGILGATINSLTLISGIFGTILILHYMTQKSINVELLYKQKSQEIVYFEQQRLFDAIKKNNEELCKFKHNIMDDLLYIKSKLEITENDDLKHYFDKISFDLKIPNICNTVNTGNKSANIIWDSFINDRRYNDVYATWYGKIPSNFPLDERDTVLLFSNVLNNAFEANANYPKGSFVHVKTQYTDKITTISIKNSSKYLPKKGPDGNFISTKSGDYHGYGTKIINDIIKKYDGSIIWDYTAEEFHVLFTLKNC